MRLLIPLFPPPTGTWGGLTRVIAIAKAAGDAGHIAILYTLAATRLRERLD